MMFFGFVGLKVLAGWLFLFPLGGFSRLRSIETISAEQAAVAPVVAALASLILLVLSFLLSWHFYGQENV